MTDNIHIRLTRTPAGVTVHSHGSAKFYDDASWTAFKEMISTFEQNNLPVIQNYVDLPTRTPLHDNTPKRGASLEDLA